MPVALGMPSCQGAWEEQDVNLYKEYPFYIADNQRKVLQRRSTWGKLCGSIDWVPNHGTEMHGISLEPTPISRQIPLPNRYTQAPQKDVFSMRERQEIATMHLHDFESPLIHWLPSFKDWQRRQMDPAMKDINNQIAIFVDQFYRGVIWAKSPYIYCCGRSQAGSTIPQLVQAPVGDMNVAMTAQNSKSFDFLKTELVDKMAGTVASTLSLRNVYAAFQAFTDDLGAMPYEGSDGLSDMEWLNGKYIFVCPRDQAANWVDDPFLKTMKNAYKEDVVHEGFGGTLFGNIEVRFEQIPSLRYGVSGDTLTLPAPETYETNPAAYNAGETLPFSDYNQAQFGLGYFVGAMPYRVIKPGPPPGEWVNGTMSAKKFAQLNWEGKARVTDFLLHQCLDANGNVVTDTNKHGRFIQILASVMCGIMPLQRRFVMPVWFRRTKVDGSRLDDFRTKAV